MEVPFDRSFQNWNARLIVFVLARNCVCFFRIDMIVCALWKKNRVFRCEDIFKPSLKYRDVKILFLKDFIITVLNSLSENKLI